LINKRRQLAPSGFSIRFVPECAFKHIALRRDSSVNQRHGNDTIIYTWIPDANASG
jgi:hypothetical protein